MKMTRRTLLRGTGATAALTSLMGVAAVGAQAAAAAAPRVAARALAPLPAIPKPPLPVIALNRLAFGPRPGDIEAFDALGATASARLAAWVDLQLAPQSIADSDCEARLAAQKLGTLTKSLPELWQQHFRVPPENLTLQRKPAADVRAMIWTRAVYSHRQLFEVMVSFWRNHFSVYGWTPPIASILPSFEQEVLRRHALGNFRELLEAVGTNPTMLFSLNNDTNRNGGPNENWARELFELHGMGAENYLGVRDPMGVPKDTQGYPLGYVDNDVYEASRCLTGWRVSNSKTDPTVGDTGEFFYSKNWHDRFNKLALGEYLPADQADMKDGRDVLDLIAYHPATSRFIARKLCRWLVADEPSAALVDRAALVFRNSRRQPDQIALVVRTIATHADFRNTWAAKIKDPFRATSAMLRALQVDWVYTDGFGAYYNPLGMPLLGRTTPDGYPDRKEPWLGTGPILYRWRLCNALVEKKIPVRQLDLLGQLPAGTNTANGIADFWIRRILGRDMYPLASRTAIVRLLADGLNPDLPLPPVQIAQRVPATVAAILMSPDFQLC
jgi:uncharacterized protein (DUF1800 family)